MAEEKKITETQNAQSTEVSTADTKEKTTKLPVEVEANANGEEEQKEFFLNKNYKKAYNKGFPNKFGRRKRFCKLCAKGIEHIDYKDVDLLYKHLTYNLKIASRRITSACAKHQRRVANAIKRAKVMALIPVKI